MANRIETLNMSELKTIFSDFSWRIVVNPKVMVVQTIKNTNKKIKNVCYPHVQVISDKV